MGEAGRDTGREGGRLPGRLSGPLPLLTGLLPMGDSDRPGRGLKRGGCGSKSSSLLPGIPAILDGLLLDLLGKAGYPEDCNISSSRST